VALVALVALVLMSLAPATAWAQKPTSQTTGYSAYEKETIKRTLEATGDKVDPAPEGKTVERIDIVRLDVLEDRDPVPEQLPFPTLRMIDSRPGTAKTPPLVPTLPARAIANSLHYTSRDFVIRREMLVKEGEPFVQVLVDETARNMRSRMPLQVSLVIIVPVKGSAPDKVVLLVITKDIWSLRLSFDLSVTPGGLEKFLLVPQETNLLGWHHTARTQFLYQPKSYTFGVGYTVPRFGSSWVGATVNASVIVNRDSGSVEGAGGGINLGQNLYSTRTDWAWGIDADVATQVARRYVNARVATYNSPATQGVNDAIPAEYRSRAVSVSAAVTRSFGWGFKNNFSLSFNAAAADYETADLSRYDPAAQADFVRRFIPRGENRVYPRLSWATFTTNYLRTLDIATLALQEDVPLGHSVSAAVYPILKALGSTRDVMGISATAGYTVRLGDGYASASVSTAAENSGDALTDASVSAGMVVVTPRLGFGRLLMGTSFLNRYKNYLRARSVLGGDDRLRGYPSNYFFGKDTVVYNLEFRSTSIEILKFAIGGVLFYDAGDAAQGFDMLRAKQSVGFGVRALFPQVNRSVLRFDFAFPLQRGPFPETGITTPVDPFGFYFAFNQAF